MYDADGAFHDLPYVYWTISQPISKVQVGDTVYLYTSAPIKQIRFKCKVMEIDVPFSMDVLNDKGYWRNGTSFDTNRLTKRYMKLKLVGENHEEERLNIWDLRSHGETSNFQGPKKIKDPAYIEFIESFITLAFYTQTIQDLLKGRNKEFDESKKKKLVRHSTTHEVFGEDFSGTVSDLYNDRKRFLDYQRHQKKANFDGVEYIVSFISEKGKDSLFVGVFKNNGETDEPSKRADSCYFGFEEVPGFEDLKERVIIEWQNPRAWHQWYNNKMKVLETGSPNTQEPDSRFQQFQLNTDNRIRHNAESITEIEARHQKMQEGIIKILKARGYDKVIAEAEHIDLRATKDGVVHFFEIKTYDTAKSCIREALGQILEYNHFPNYIRAEVMHIIGPVAPSEDEVLYVKFLNNTYNLGIDYWWFSESENKLYP